MLCVLEGKCDVRFTMIIYHQLITARHRSPLRYFCALMRLLLPYPSLHFSQAQQLKKES